MLSYYEWAISMCQTLAKNSLNVIFSIFSATLLYLFLLSA